MALRESDREDLLREATALVERAELTIEGDEEPIVVGFRRDSSASFFFGADPVYQFNSALELRRAYVGGLLYKAECGRLVSLRRERSAGTISLFRTELTVQEATDFLAGMRKRLSALRLALQNGRFLLTGQVPLEADIPDRIRCWLDVLPTRIEIAQAPNVG
jgi:hypothetical protein